MTSSALSKDVQKATDVAAGSIKPWRRRKILSRHQAGAEVSGAEHALESASTRLRPATDTASPDGAPETASDAGTSMARNGRLNNSTPGAGSSDAAGACGHHHGRQRALGHGAPAIPRVEGHRRGWKALRRCVRARRVGSASFTSPYLLQRELVAAAERVSDGLKLFLRHDLAVLPPGGVRIKGDRRPLRWRPESSLLEEAEALTRDNTGLTLVVAFSYGARARKSRRRARSRQAAARRTSAPRIMTVEAISSHRDTAGIPDPDLIVRTSGGSGCQFLLWRGGYLVRLPAYWPDFDEACSPPPSPNTNSATAGSATSPNAPGLDARHRWKRSEAAHPVGLGARAGGARHHLAQRAATTVLMGLAGLVLP